MTPNGLENIHEAKRTFFSSTTIATYHEVDICQNLNCVDSIKKREQI